MEDRPDRNEPHKERKRGGTRKLARDKVFDVAADLFYREGVRAVGVDAIVKKAGVAKISLYRTFPSKDDLVIAYLKDRQTEFWRQWDEAFSQHPGDPRGQLQAITAYLAHRTTQRGYRGCPFINFSAEFPDPAHPGRQVAKAVKREMRERFVGIAEALGARRPQQLADGLLLLVEGAQAISQTLASGLYGPGTALVWAAEVLVEAQLEQRTAHP